MEIDATTALMGEFERKHTSSLRLRDLSLVLDDVHRLDGAVRTLELLDALLDNAPADWCVVLSGRRLENRARMRP